MRLQRPLLLRRAASRRKEDALAAAPATEVSPLSFETCHTLYTFPPRSAPEHSRRPRFLSRDSKPHAIFTVLGRSGGPVVGSHASIKVTTGVSSAKLARRLGVESILSQAPEQTRVEQGITTGVRGRHHDGHSVQGHTY
jgi:hypothetical protein